MNDRDHETPMLVVPRPIMRAHPRDPQAVDWHQPGTHREPHEHVIREDVRDAAAKNRLAAHIEMWHRPLEDNDGSP